MSTLSFTADAAKDLARAYSTPDVQNQRAATRAILELRPGARVLDIGCGPGFLCEEMAAEVGSDGKVLGVDISSDQITLCRSRTPPEHLTYAEGDATDLPVEVSAFDVAVCTQVAEYVPDTGQLLAEIRRVLAPSGRALIMATDWDCVAWESDDTERMARVMQLWESHCAHPRLPRVLGGALNDAGFATVDATAHPIINLSFTPETYSHGAANLIRSYVSQNGMTEAEADAWFEELVRLDTAGRYYFSTARTIFTARKPG